MANLNRAELIEEIDLERRETNSAFISVDSTISLLKRAVMRLLREPGIKTIEESQNITAVNGTSRYALNEDFKEVITLFSGENTSTGVMFEYKPVDEYNQVVSGYVYTFKEPGYIDIKFPDETSLPSTTLVLRYWSKNIIISGDGLTKKSSFTDDEDKSRLPFEFDEFYIMWVTSRILKREGKKEWADYLTQATEVISMLKEQPGSKSRRPRRSFGHYLN